MSTATTITPGNCTVVADLARLAEQTIAGLPSAHTAAGEPLRKRSRIVNGHKVTAWIAGWDDSRPVVFEVDHSTEPLGLAEAASRVA